jgi:hypothetical protein
VILKLTEPKQIMRSFEVGFAAKVFLQQSKNMNHQLNPGGCQCRAVICTNNVVEPRLGDRTISSATAAGKAVKGHKGKDICRK